MVTFFETYGFLNFNSFLFAAKEQDCVQCDLFPLGR